MVAVSAPESVSRQRLGVAEDGIHIRHVREVDARARRIRGSRLARHDNGVAALNLRVSDSAISRDLSFPRSMLSKTARTKQSGPRLLRPRCTGSRCGCRPDAGRTSWHRRILVKRHSRTLAHPTVLSVLATSREEEGQNTSAADATSKARALGSEVV